MLLLGGDLSEYKEMYSRTYPIFVSEGYDRNNAAYV